MSARVGPGGPLASWPVRVLMRRRADASVPWGIPRWELLAVLPDTAPPAAIERRLVHDGGDAARDYEWAGLEVPLFRDAAESYWYNLVGREPSLCVICRAGRDIELEPFAVTANYDEAGAYMEADDTVFSAPLPAPLVTELEQFIMNHYRPVAPRKRKRRDWAAEADHGGQGQSPDDTAE